MEDGGYISMKPGSELVIEAYHVDPSAPSSEKVKIDLIKGTLRSITGNVGKARQVPLPS